MYKGTLLEFPGQIREDIVAQLLAACNLMGPPKSGGYSIRKVGSIDKFDVLFFTELDRAPAETSPAFVSDEIVYAKTMVPFVIRVLARSGLKHYSIHTEVELPQEIVAYVRQNAK